MPRIRRLLRTAALCSVAISLLPATVVAQTPQTPQTARTAPRDDSRLTLERIFRDAEFRSAPLPTVRWLADGRSYLEVRPASGAGSNLVRVDVRSGAATMVAAADRLVDQQGRRVRVEDVILSTDESRALLFHSSELVWRQATRGRYDVLELASGRIAPISTDTGLQMFAKFSPDGRQVAFVRHNDLYLTDLATGQERRLTTDGSDVIINGTTDWVYEEELRLRDAFRWSPDGRRIAFWRFDQSPIPVFALIDETRLYPEVKGLRYPKAGTANSRVIVGVIELETGALRWLEAGPDTGQYIARMEWVGTDSVMVLRMPRRQNTGDLLMLSATSGRGRTIFTERDTAYIEVQAPRWIGNDRFFLWSSDRTGWRQVFLYDRAGRVVRQLTRDGHDVISIDHVDENRGHLYVTVAAPDATQRQIHRYDIGPLTGRAAAAPRRATAPTVVTPAAGSHSVSIGPGARFLVGVHSTANRPSTSTLYELPAMRQVRVLQDNSALIERMGALAIRPAEFLRVPMPDGTELDAWRIVPADFDSTRAYPVLMYTYGGPAAPRVNDAFEGNRHLFHQYLAQRGYVVVSVDNRGSAWRGRDFRKITQLDLGRWESQDQIDAARWIGSQSWGDQQRIAIWGWSYGGYLASLAAARGGNVFRAAIAVAPVTDWRFYDTIYTERFMWTPQENPEGYRRSAPLNHIETLTAPILLIHGTGDDNVHAQNTLVFAEALQNAGKPFSLQLYPNKTHSISGAATQTHLYGSIERFLREQL